MFDEDYNADCASAKDGEDLDQFDDGEDDDVDGDDSDLDDLDASVVEDEEDVDLDEMNARGRRLRGRGRKRRRRRYAPCRCPQCLMDEEMGDEDSDAEVDDDSEDDEDNEDDEDGEDADDESDLDALEELAVEDDEDDDLEAEDDDLEAEDDDLDALDARRRRRGRGRRRRSRRNAPCSCPQCLMDDEMAGEDSDGDVEDAEDVEDDDSDDDEDDEDADNESDLDALDEFAVEDDKDDDLDALDARRRRRGRGRRRRSRRNAPCSCPQCLMDDEMADGDGDNDCACADEADDLGEDELDDEDDEDDEGEDDELEAADDESDDDEGDFDDDERDYDEALEDEDALDGNDFESFEDAVGDLDDEEDAREPVFKGFFSDGDKQNIRAALRIAQTQASRAKSVFDRIMRSKGRKRISAYRRTPFVQRFFGHRFVTSGEIRRIRRRVRKIERILRKRRIRFNRAFADASRCRGGSSAFVRAAGGIRRLYVCPRFLTRAPSVNARTIIHELVHEIGFCHYSTTGRVRCTRAGASTEGESAVLAFRHATKARKNPQNYVWLFDRLQRHGVR